MSLKSIDGNIGGIGGITININKNVGSLYKVKSGDTLSSIAIANDVELMDLEAANPDIDDFDYIEAGQVINLPSQTDGESSVESSIDSNIYTVKENDTLSSIANKYGLTYQELAEYNNIENPDVIAIGQNIVIPGIENTETIADTSSTIILDEEPQTVEGVEVALDSSIDSEKNEEVIVVGEDISNEETVIVGVDDATGLGSEAEISYTVKSGDTLSSIAASYGLSYQELALYNSIENASLINTGQVIKIPTSGEVVDSSSQISEIVSSDGKQEITNIEVHNANAEALGLTNFIEENADNWGIDINLSNVEVGSKIYDAILEYYDEIINSTYVYINDDTLITINYDTISGEEVLVSHVILNDSSQISKENANGSYASGKETTSSAAARLGAILAINGSHFLDDGSEDLRFETNNIAISDGQIITDGVSGGNELYLDANGNLYTTSSGTSASSLIASGVTDSFLLS